MSVPEIARWWGDQLLPVPADPIGPHASEATCRVLTTVGMPAGGPLSIELYHDERLSTPLRCSGRDYFVLADDQVVRYVTPAGSDEVRDLSRTRPAQFV